jgi:hypothetical protein
VLYNLYSMSWKEKGFKRMVMMVRRDWFSLNFQSGSYKSYAILFFNGLWVFFLIKEVLDAFRRG